MQWEGERGGPGAAELVKEWLNMHLPPPETLIKEERGQVPDAPGNVHTQALFIKTGFGVRFEESPPSKPSRQPRAALFLVVSYFSGIFPEMGNDWTRRDEGEVSRRDRERRPALL